MPEDNRFAGLSEAVDEDETDESADGTGTAATAEENSSGRADSADGEPVVSGSAGNTTASDSESEPADSAESDDPAAFPFDATEKKTVYVRPETLDDLEDARALVDAQLRTDHDVRDLTGREFYDAVFRFAASDTSGLIDEILEAREE